MITRIRTSAALKGVSKLLLLVLGLSVSASLATDSSPPVKVNLRAPWPAAPLVLEALEAFNSIDSSRFFDAVTHLSDAGAFSAQDERTEKEVHKLVKDTLRNDGLFRLPASEQLWDLALALHSESPKVEAFWHLYRTTGLDKLYAEQVSEPSRCGSFALLDGKVLCDADALVAQVAASRNEVLLQVPFDHTLTPRNHSYVNATELPSVILYADTSSSNFAELHRALHAHASGSSDTPLRYILRWKPVRTRNKTVHIAGYGAALDLKKVDYLVLDDRKLKDSLSEPFLRLQDDMKATERTQEQQTIGDRRWLQAIMGAEDGTTGTDDVGEKLSSSELERLGFKAVQVIKASGDPIRALRELSQNFPFYAKRLASIDLKEEVEAELEDNHMTRVEPASNDVWLNGKVLERKDFNPLGLLKEVKSEARLIHSLTREDGLVKLTPGQAIGLLSNATLGKAFIGAQTESTLVDASDRIERGLRTLSGETVERESAKGTRAITWWNDLEKDAAFQKWSDDLETLLRPMWPGSFPQIRRNIFHVIAAIDLSRKESGRVIAESIYAASKRVGLHWGFVPIWPEGNSNAVRLARMFYHVWDMLDPEGTARYLRRVALSGSPSSGIVDMEEATSEFRAALGIIQSNEEIEEVLAQINTPTSTFAQARIASAAAWAKRIGASVADTPRGVVFVNGQQIPINPALTQNVGQVVQGQLHLLAPLIYYKTITDKEDLTHYFYDLPETLTFRSPLLGGGGRKSKVSTRLNNLAHLDPVLFQVSPFTAYLSKDPGQVNATVWIAADLDSPDGSHLAEAAIRALQGGIFRLSFLHVPSGPSSSGTSKLSSALHHLLVHRPDVGAEELLQLFSTDAEGIPSEAITEAFASASDPDNREDARSWWQLAFPAFAELHLKAGEPSIMVNGRALSGFGANTITANDIQALARFEATKRGSKVHAHLQEMTGKAPSELAQLSLRVALVASALAADSAPDEAAQGLFQKQPTVRIDAFDLISIKHSGFEIGNRDASRFRFTVVIDPLSETAQKWASNIETVARWPDTYLKVILNPMPILAENPLNRFYRFLSLGEPSFTSAGELQNATIIFAGMPEDAVLTLGLDTPSTWLAMAEEAIYDLDNIKLSGLPQASREAGVSATYELKRILIEGHARIGSNNDIPRGLQLVLETTDGSEQLDTIVMENLAYFQFRARPGLWHLKIREGRSSDVYEIVSVGNLGWNSPPANVTGDVVTLASLDGLTIYPQVAKRVGMEGEELLEGDTRSQGDASESAVQGVMNAAKSVIGSLSKKLDAATKALQKPSPHADINIFTVASGHLYERMTYIMILSVLKHTKHSVKFWFIENFLSPSFKEFIPHFASEYGFKYELVSYAWPHWLRSQKEKQRVIWGNKILFLDVLFPLDLDKVIFVDADQIVRTDMIELVNEDLHGAPYGYPPMGNDSYDMDQFRFWEQGYWKEFLRGKPYHISALYVVDLVRFRQIAAGDGLRGQYQALSADPNSLANLDQDLPNNLQFHIPIHTLAQEWLWCETWCSHDWLDKAKTIDLCSNPKTKEPKLDRARRQIPEWTVLDDEVARFAAKLSQESLIGTNVVSKAETEFAGDAQAEGGVQGSSSHPDAGKGEEDGKSLHHDEL